VGHRIHTESGIIGWRCLGASSTQAPHDLHQQPRTEACPRPYATETQIPRSESRHATGSCRWGYRHRRCHTTHDLDLETRRRWKGRSRRTPPHRIFCKGTYLVQTKLSVQTSNLSHVMLIKETCTYDSSVSLSSLIFFRMRLSTYDSSVSLSSLLFLE
jgi:hypothetical protein